MAAGPDALSFDLEDAVAETGKAAARLAVAETLRAARLSTQVWVRINAVRSGHTVADILSLADAHVERIKTLTRRKFFDGLKFFRVIDDFMAQTGDPQNTGEGDSDLPNLAPQFKFLNFSR
jgi:peptidylprolyl isomerase